LSASDIALVAREFLRNPAAIGAVAPSSARLAAAVVAPIPSRGDPLVVELGSGTGAFTSAIQAQLGGRGHHVAVELNPRLAALAARRFPAVEVVHGNAEHLPEILGSRLLGHADVVVSGLPWAAFPQAAQQSILDGVLAVLSPNGAFTTFGYVGVHGMRPARRFRAMLAERFEEVVAGRMVVQNLPPAFVYYTRRPVIAEPVAVPLRVRDAGIASWSR
jgi:phospholipid N-methyltransferase